MATFLAPIFLDFTFTISWLPPFWAAFHTIAWTTQHLEIYCYQSQIIYSFKLSAFNKSLYAIYKVSYFYNCLINFYFTLNLDYFINSIPINTTLSFKLPQIYILILYFLLYLNKKNSLSSIFFEISGKLYLIWNNYFI